MSDANTRTIRTYQTGVERYIDGTQAIVSGNQKKWIDLAFSDIESSARVLEIGSAFGRDAMYLMSLGYKPHLTDATPGFVEYLRTKGLDAEVLDIINDRPPGTYDAVFASAVFLHFTNADFDKAVKHVHDSLDKNGKFIFSLKKGQGETWSTEKMGQERYFHYWERSTVDARLGRYGLSLVNEHTFEDDIWLYLTARRFAS